MQALMDYLNGVASLAPAPGPRAVWRMWSRRSVRTVVFVAGAAAAAFGLLVAVANAQVGHMPAGWYGVGNQGGDYAVGADRSRRDGGQGQGGGTIRSLTENPQNFATLQQSIRADEYRGQRVRLSGYVKMQSEPYVASARLWMQVDGPAEAESNDYMQERPILQDAPWARYSVVLDVPRNAAGLSFGILLFGEGQVWLDDVALERVGREVPLTGRRGQLMAIGTAPSALRADALRRRSQNVAYRDAPLRPVNLSFLEGTRTP